MGAGVLLSVDLMLWHWADGVQHALPECWKALPTTTLHAFYADIAKTRGVARRLQTRTEKYSGVAPGF